MMAAGAYDCDAGPACGSCCGGCYQGCFNPLAPVGWALRVLGVGCSCGGCDRERYWGEWHGGCDPCDPCGNFVGAGRVSRAPWFGYGSRGCSDCGPGGSVSEFDGGAPLSMRASPSGQPCNCNKGSISQSQYRTPSKYASQGSASRSSSKYASHPSAVPQKGYYTSRPSSSVAQRDAHDPYSPKLLSVTDRVVKPASAESPEVVDETVAGRTWTPRTTTRQ